MEQSAWVNTDAPPPRTVAYPAEWDKAAAERSRRAPARLSALGFPLTAQECAYVDARMHGFFAYQAWGLAHPGRNSKATCAAGAALWARERPWLAAEVQTMRRLLDESASLTRAAKRHLLARVAFGDVEARPEARIAAIGMDNAMTGDNEPAKTDVAVNVTFSVDPTGLGRRALRAEGPARPLLATVEP